MKRKKNSIVLFIFLISGFHSFNSLSSSDKWDIRGLFSCLHCNFYNVAAPHRINLNKRLDKTSSETRLTRFYSTRSKKARLVKVHVDIPKKPDEYKLNPRWVTGWSDGEGCFVCSIVENKYLKIGWRVKPSFQIKQHAKDRPVLVEIQKSLGVGQISNAGPSAVQFRVSSSRELEAVINHFEKYPLITKKRADYFPWKEILKICRRKDHLTPNGLRKIVVLKASINWGLSPKLQTAFPDVVPAERPNVELPKTIYPHWLAGFTAAEGSFMVKIQKSKTIVGYSVYLVFQLTQHARDKQLMRIIFKYLDCGNIYKRGEAIDLRISKLSDILNKIIPFFKKYPIKGVKAKDFNDLCIVAEMMKNKAHLTKKGLEQIRQIKAGMNAGRRSSV